MPRFAIPIVLIVLFAGCSDPVRPVPAEPSAEFITVRRAWQPGERDSTIARIKRNREFNFPYIGDISDDADRIYADPDSVTEIAPNPAFALSGLNESSLLLEPRFATNWNITGVDVLEINSAAKDTLHWIGVFWSNPTESTWKGFALGAAVRTAATTTFPQTVVNTNGFDASGGKTGAAAGEVRASTSTSWLGNGPGIAPNNTLQVSSSVYGAASTVTTGPFLGGTSATGSMQGRMLTIDMARATGAGSPATFQVGLDFRTAAITSIRYVCVFRSPCTTNVP